jgi:hypothetical protein
MQHTRDRARWPGEAAQHLAEEEPILADVLRHPVALDLVAPS